MTHMMIDLETFGQSPGCIFKQIGWALFDERQEDAVVDSGLIHVSKEDAESHGLVADESTMKWWAKQGPEARAAMEVPGISVKAALNQLSSLFAGAAPYRVWSCDPDFDLAILAYAYKSIEGAGQIPWKFWETRSVRTILEAAKVTRRKPKVAHNGESDAVAQALSVADALRKLNNI